MDTIRAQKSVIFAFILFTIGTRIWLGFNHFSHIDDLLVKDSIFSNYEGFIEYLDVRESRINDPIDREIYSFLKPVLTNPIIFKVCKGVIKPAILSKNSTYAPLGYFLSSYIPYSPQSSYMLTKFWVRLMSLVPWIILLIYNLVKYRESYLSHLVICGSTLLTAYSVQAAPYVWPVLLGYYVINKLITNEIDTGLKCTVILGTWFSYLFIPYALLFALFRFRRNKITSLLSLLSIGICYVVFIRTKASGINHWNLGHDMAYFIRPMSFEGIGDMIQNLPLVIYSLITPFETLGFHLMYCLGISWTLLGLVLLYNMERQTRRVILAFAIILVGFIFIGKLPFTPTRHSLVWLPPIIVLTRNLYYSPNTKGVITFVTLILIFIYPVKHRLDARKDKFDTHSTLIKSLTNSNIFFIKSVGWTAQVEYFIPKRFSVSKQSGVSYFSPVEATELDTLVISHRLIDFEREHCDSIVCFEPSTTEIGISGLTKNGENGLYIGVKNGE